MPEMEPHPVLPKMIGETITTKPPDSVLYPRRNWIIIEKLSEDPIPVTPEDFRDGMGPAYTAGKYLCRLTGAGNAQIFGFMRIYKQIPLAGTELDSSSVRKAQASKPYNHVELDALNDTESERQEVAEEIKYIGMSGQLWNLILYALLLRNSTLY
ncbi:hypothetical protein N7447_002918 [Penicillium robsamsonii]|uniref:uncharacterized protein n=1 Tax=Penicillium robsamsonii TaxID=1792511 RepID=UPI002546F483|nr:uncharacterized protein N7447_002918 [Penicillium robsamsonii]KAJ5836892.1 hypothetical protein N7447_002918 [Penicillium robsamsonii]